MFVSKHNPLNNFKEDKYMNAMYDKTGLAMEYKMAHGFYENELDRVVSSLHQNAMPGTIRWKKWDKEKFDKYLKTFFKKIYLVNINPELVYAQVILEYPLIYVQQDFMEEVYGYTYSSKGGIFKDYGNIVFHAIPAYGGNYHFEEFLYYWIFKILRPKYQKWVKSGKINKTEISHRWYPLCDVILHYDNSLSKEDVKVMLTKCLKACKIKVKEITDYEIIF